jgi:porin
VAVYISTKRGLDLDELPEITLPVEAETILGDKKGQWHLQYSFTHELWRSAGSSRSWGLFGRIGLWDANPTPFRWQVALGVSGDAPFPMRSRDRFGVGVFKTELSETLRHGLEPLVALGHDSGAELFYTFALVERVHLTVNAQWVDPARSLEDQMRFLGMRLNLSF